MIRIAIIGTGNVAHHLAKTIGAIRRLQLVQVIGRNSQGLSPFKMGAPTQVGFDKLAAADVYIIAVSDDQISSVSEQLSNCKGLVVHTSGSVPMVALKAHKKRGVFYPLQTFSKERAVNFKEVPICIEVAEKETHALLWELAGCMSSKVFNISSEQRKHLHLAAVFANNFSNHLYQIAYEICEKQQISPNLLSSLILETAKKIENLMPVEAQTGPAIRKDQQTMQQHIKLLENTIHQEIYTLLSNSIKETHG